MPTTQGIRIDESVQQAILCASALIAFRVRVRDAKVLADEFFPEFSVVLGDNYICAAHM